MSTFIGALRLIYKGLRNPTRIPGYVQRTISSDDGAGRTVTNGVVTWDTEALQTETHWGAGDTPQEISAYDYYIATQLREDLRNREYDHAVEVGCGYGRATPWLSEFATNVTGIDANIGVLSMAKEYYPSIEVVGAAAQRLPTADDSVDLLFTRGVLMHIPPDDIASVADEMKRVASEDADVLLSEDVIREESVDKRVQDPDSTYHLRTKSEYQELFDPFELTRCRSAEIPFDEPHPHTTRLRMLFTST